MIAKLGLAALLVLAASTKCAAQTVLTENTLQLNDGADRPAATIDDVAWMAGHWRGEGLGGVVEETWTSPLDGTMAGAFRLVSNGEISFYEMMAFVETDGSLELWVKHFNPDFTGWEEKEDKVVFRLVERSPGTARFDGLTFQQSGGDSLNVFLAMRKDGSVEEAKLTYRRVH